MKKRVVTSAVLVAAIGMAGFAQAQVKIGVMGPITGSNAAFGAQLKNGAEQAIADINAAGGILGQKIEMVLGDDAGKPEQGVSVANKFVGDRVRFVVGAFNSGVSIPASEVLQENNILQITPASTNPRYTERKMWNTFRVCGRDDQQGSAAAEIISKLYKGKKVAIVHDRTTYGKGLADEMRAALKKAGGVQEVMYDGIAVGEKDFSAVVSRIKQSGADVLFWAACTRKAACCCARCAVRA